MNGLIRTIPDEVLPSRTSSLGSILSGDWRSLKSKLQRRKQYAETSPLRLVHFVWRTPHASRGRLCKLLLELRQSPLRKDPRLRAAVSIDQPGNTRTYVESAGCRVEKNLRLESDRERSGI